MTDKDIIESVVLNYIIDRRENSVTVKKWDINI